MTEDQFRTLVTDAIEPLLRERRLGQLQEFRKRLRGLKRRPSSGVFSSNTIFGHYAYHHGGRKELQFNLGLEDEQEQLYLRHGVAFSFQKSQGLTDLKVLDPWVRGFNRFFEANPRAYANLRLWEWRGDTRGVERSAGGIPSEWVREGSFVFLGTRQRVADRSPNIDRICDDLDNLFPLYQYVSATATQDSNANLAYWPPATFTFQPSISERKSFTKKSQTAMSSDVELRHSKIQGILCDRLVAEYGKDNVGMEHDCPSGGYIDVVVRHENGYAYYEIKTGWSPRQCIRDALGQLLEYAFWNPVPQHTIVRLIVVGEADLDESGKKYLTLLKEHFNLPIEYEVVNLV